MKNIKGISIFYFLFLLILSSCTTNEEPIADSKPDYQQLETELREMMSYSMQVFSEKDLDGMVGRFAADGTLKIPNTPIVYGTEALREYYGNTLRLEDFKLDLNVIRIEIAEAGDMAYVLSDFDVSFFTPGGPFHDTGSSLIVFKRINDAWKIVSENLSSDPKVVLEL